MLILELTNAVSGLGKTGDVVIARRKISPKKEDFVVVINGGGFIVRRWRSGCPCNAVVTFPAR